MEKAEFEHHLELLNSLECYKRRFVVSTAMKFQFAMIARIDDTSHFKKEDLKPNPQFGFTLLAQMMWSKNVMDERAAPNQLLFGADSPRFCLLLALSVHLEAWLATGDGLHSEWLLGSNQPKTTAAFISQAYKEASEDPTFAPLAIGPLGSHSMQKFPSTYARRNGCSRDDVNARGRRQQKTVVDRYIDMSLPYPDAKVAAVLAIGGPVRYRCKNGSNISDAFLRSHVVPNMIQSQHINEGVSMVLALPLLWSALDPGMENYMPGWLRGRIVAAYATVRQLPEGGNPVEKVPLIISGHGGSFTSMSFRGMRAIQGRQVILQMR